MSYDFHRYGQLLYGVVWLTAGVICVRSVGQIKRGDPPGWRGARLGSAALVAVHLPVVPIQPAAAIPMTAGLVNLVVLHRASRRRV